MTPILLAWRFAGVTSVSQRKGLRGGRGWGGPRGWLPSSASGHAMDPTSLRTSTLSTLERQIVLHSAHGEKLERGEWTHSKLGYMEKPYFQYSVLGKSSWISV